MRGRLSYALATLAATLPPLAESTTYEVTFTSTSSYDNAGQANCHSNAATCGFYASPGYSAAVSENLFGVDPGAGAGPACGTCYRLMLLRDPSGGPIQNAGGPIVVMVNNLCPQKDANGDDNPICMMSDTSRSFMNQLGAGNRTSQFGGGNSTNQLGGAVDFNLCDDDGGRAALFGNSMVGLAVGTATEVSCSEWGGTKRFDAGSAASGVTQGGGKKGGAERLAAFSLWMWAPLIAMMGL